MGKVFGKAFTILGLDERKGRRVVKQIKVFTEIFGSMLHGFLPCSLVSLTESCSFWYSLKNLLNPYKLVESLAIKTDDVTSGGRDLDPHGRLWAVQRQMS